MKKVLALLLAALIALSITACGEKKVSNLAQDFLDKLPSQTESSSQSSQPEPATPENGEGGEESAPEKPEDPKPGKDLYDYANPSDHPHEGPDFTVYNGIYHNQEPLEGYDDVWVQITGFNEFILMEYFFLEADGSVYSFYTEEFWPDEGWYASTETTSVSGKSQQFSSMGQYDCYNNLPKNRRIEWNEDGVSLQYEGEEPTVFLRDESFTGHTAQDEMRDTLGEDVHLDFEFQYDSEDVLGTWAMSGGWDCGSVTFAEDGTFSFFRKTPGEPVIALQGVYGFGTYSGNLVGTAERIGYGTSSYAFDWEWSIDSMGYLCINDYEENVLPGEFTFWRIENAFFTTLDQTIAMGYLRSEIESYGSYTDQYDITYDYYYDVPVFIGYDNSDMARINDTLLGYYGTVVANELEAMNNGEMLTYDYVGWRSAVYEDILFLEVKHTNTYMEDYTAFYIDLLTMREVESDFVLERLGISEEDFLDTVRAMVKEYFEFQYAEIPEDQLEEYDYSKCLEESLSDDFINLDLPIFVNRYGEMSVQIKMSSSAGAGFAWGEIYPFSLWEESN